ncbi:MAG: hypothetical protein QXT94_01520 [Methanothrix sp.]|jgi:hypothetical protein
MSTKNKQAHGSEKYKFIMRKESKLPAVDESKIESLLNELIEDYKSGKPEIVSFGNSVLKPGANLTEEAAKAIKYLLTEHGIVGLEDKRYQDMAKILLDAVNRIASSSSEPQ